MHCFVSQVLVNDPVIVSLCFLSSSVMEITLTHRFLDATVPCGPLVIPYELRISYTLEIVNLM